MNVKFLRNSQVPFAFYWSFSHAADGSPNDCSEDMCTMGPCLLVKLRKKVSGTDRWMVSKAEQRPRNIMRSLQSLTRGCSLLQSTLKARGFGASFHLWYFFTLKFMAEMYDSDIQWWLPNQYQRTLKSISTSAIKNSTLHIFCIRVRVITNKICQPEWNMLFFVQFLFKKYLIMLKKHGWSKSPLFSVVYIGFKLWLSERSSLTWQFGVFFFSNFHLF